MDANAELKYRMKLWAAKEQLYVRCSLWALCCILLAGVLFVLAQYTQRLVDGRLNGWTLYSNLLFIPIAAPFGVLPVLLRRDPLFPTRIIFSQAVYTDMTTTEARKCLLRHRCCSLVWCLFLWLLIGFVSNVGIPGQPVFLWPSEKFIVEYGSVFFGALGAVLLVLRSALRFQYSVVPVLMLIMGTGVNVTLTYHQQFTVGSKVTMLWGGSIIFGAIIVSLSFDQEAQSRQDFLLNDADTVLQRYHIANELPVHRSKSCVVHLAKDVGGRNQTLGNAEAVALKFMQHRSQFEQELVSRVIGFTAEDNTESSIRDWMCHKGSVVGVLGYHLHAGDALNHTLMRLKPQESKALERLQREAVSTLDLEWIESRQLKQYPYVLVLDQASQSLFNRLGSQRMAGHNIKAALRVFLEPRNILFQPDNKVVLCDLDAAMVLGNARTRDDKPGSSAYYAPEVARWVLACDESTTTPHLEAAAALDVWSLGVLLFELCAGQHLFSQDISDDSMANRSDYMRLTVWLCIPEEQLKLVAEQLKLEATLVAPAIHLVRWCLQGNPAKRPSLSQILTHPLLDGPNSIPSGTEEEEPRSVLSRAVLPKDCGTLFFLLRQLGIVCWRDMNANDLTEAGMRQGVYDSECFILFLTNSVLSRSWCLKEMQWALEFGKTFMIIVENEERFWAWDYDRWTEDQCDRVPGSTKFTKGQLQHTYSQAMEKYPAVVEEIKRQHKAGSMLPFRRRGFEVDALVRELLQLSGCDWGSCLPPEDALVEARLSLRRCIHIISDPAVVDLVCDLTEALYSLSNAVTITQDLDTATHVIVLLTGNLLEKCTSELARLLTKKKLLQNVVYVYDTEHGWDFDRFKHLPETPIKAQIANHEAQVWRAPSQRGGWQYEFKAMMLELLRKLQ